MKGDVYDQLPMQLSGIGQSAIIRLGDTSRFALGTVSECRDAEKLTAIAARLTCLPKHARIFMVCLY